VNLFKPSTEDYPKSWDEVLKRYNISNKSISPLLFSNVLTLGYIIKNHIEDLSNKKVIHLIGCDFEADLVPLFETFLYLFPKKGLNIEIHMYGPLISNAFNNKIFQFNKNENIVKVKIISSCYPQKAVQEKPDLLVALNPNFFLDKNWVKSIPFIFNLKPKNLKFVITERHGNAIYAIDRYTKQCNIKTLQVSEINPFREPYADYVNGILIPCIRNCFFFVL